MTKYYTTSEVAKFCNVHRNTIIGAIRKGLLKIHRTPGGHARIAQDDLDDFCHRRSLPTTSLISRNNRVLVVDDGSQHLAVLAQGLRDAGYLVESANDPFRAGFMVATFAPNVLLVNAGKTGELGEQVTRQVRALPRQRDLAVVGMAAGRDSEGSRGLLAAGADEVLSRPVELDNLIKRIVGLIGPVVTGTSGRASTESTRRVERAELDDERATRKAAPRGDRFHSTSVDGVLSAEREDES
ncbi:MAG: excisionase family DNA-binding protein [Planctomycetes bacterium]|nr:excisionase family DNA-binding protein [Planctomycetota bacterium]MCL4731805.1 excisionase family DNA-binding protein [Planctomycetota bacterium]